MKQVAAGGQPGGACPGHGPAGGCLPAAEPRRRHRRGDPHSQPPLPPFAPRLTSPPMLAVAAGERTAAEAAGHAADAAAGRRPSRPRVSRGGRLPHHGRVLGGHPPPRHPGLHHQVPHHHPLPPPIHPLTSPSPSPPPPGLWAAWLWTAARRWCVSRWWRAWRCCWTSPFPTPSCGPPCPSPPLCCTTRPTGSAPPSSPCSTRSALPPNLPILQLA